MILWLAATQISLALDYLHSMRQRSSSRFLARVLPGAKPAPFPDFIEPCLASLRTSVSSASGFVHELKLDGYRVQAHQHDGRVRLYTRSGLDWTNRFPTIAADVGRLPASKLVIDGEVISADGQGRPNFSTLQDNLKRKRYDRMVYYAFDLLHLDGFDTRTAPLIDLDPKGGKRRYLHDGRAGSIEEAIRWHGGEAEAAKRRFEALAPDEKAALIAFVRSL